MDVRNIKIYFLFLFLLPSFPTLLHADTPTPSFTPWAQPTNVCCNGGPSTVVFTDPYSSNSSLNNYNFYIGDNGLVDPNYTNYFSATGGSLVNTANPTYASDQLVLTSANFNPTQSNYTVECDVMANQTGSLFGIMGRAQDGANFYDFVFNHGQWQIERHTSTEGLTYLATSYTPNYVAGTWVHLTLVCCGNNPLCYVDNQLLFNVTDSTFASGEPGIRSGYMSSPTVNTFANYQVSVCQPTTPTPTPPPTQTPTSTYSSTATETQTSVPTDTPTLTQTPTLTATSTPSQTLTPTITATFTVTATPAIGSCCYNLVDSWPFTEKASVIGHDDNFPMAVDEWGDVFVTQDNNASGSFVNQVIEYDACGNLRAAFTIPGTNIPIYALAVNADGSQIYVAYADKGSPTVTHGVYVYNPSGFMLNNLTSIPYAQALAVDASGDVYAAAATAVVEYSSAGVSMRTVYDKTIVGEPPYIGGITAIVLDGNGNLFVGDGDNIVKVNLAGPSLTTYFIGGNTANQPKVIGVRALTVDSSGNVFDLDQSSDGNINRSNYIYKFDNNLVPQCYYEEADMTNIELMGMAMMPNGVIFAMDYLNNNRIVELAPCGTSAVACQLATPPPSPTPTTTGTPTATATVTKTVTLTKTPTPTFTPTFTKTITMTPSVTKTFTPTITRTPTKTPTPLGGAVVHAGILEVEHPTETPTPSSTPTLSPTPIYLTATPGEGNLRSIVAEPNLSKGGEPIRFEVNLDQSASLDLVLYTVSGELVYETRVQGRVGLNEFIWNLQTHGNIPVASGLYIYVVRLEDSNGLDSRVGKVLVLH